MPQLVQKSRNARESAHPRMLNDPFVLLILFYMSNISFYSLIFSQNTMFFNIRTTLYINHFRLINTLLSYMSLVREPSATATLH